MTATRGDERSLVARTFKILEAFTEHDDTVGLAELTRRTGLPKSTVYRIASNLVRTGILSREHGDFRLSMNLYELGALVPAQRRLRQICIPFMEELHQKSREIVHLGVLSGPDVLYIVKVAGHNQMPLPTRDGGRMPAHCTALGKAMLAFSPPAAVADVLAGGLPATTRYTIRTPQAFLDALAKVVEEGVAYDREEAVIGSTCVAAPIIDKRKRVRAAISVSGPTSRFEPETMARPVKQSASTISRLLGTAEEAERQ